MKRPPSPTELLTRVRSQVTWRRIVLAVVLTMNLRTFEFFPGGRPVEEVWFVLCLLTFACLYPLFKSRSDWKFSRLELYLLGMIIVLAILPALTSYNVFGQPLIYGILARRSTVLVTTWLLFIQVWRRGWVSADDIEAVLVFLVWFVFVLYSCMRLFLDPLAYPNAPFGFILGLGTETQTFAVPGYLLPFGVIYYALRGVRERRLKLYVYAAALFLVCAGSSWRALTLSLGITIFFFLFSWRPAAEALKAVAKFAVMMLVVVAILRAVRPDFVADTATHFAAAVQVAVGGAKEGVDPSADARVEEANIALPYVERYPILGVGEISGQWQGGPGEVLGGYFSASDIGVLGTLFTYGIVGLVFALGQYLFPLAAAFDKRRYFHTSLYDAVKGFVLFSALFSITTSFFIVALGTNTFFILLSVLLPGEAKRSVSVANYNFGSRAALPPNG